MTNIEHPMNTAVECAIRKAHEIRTGCSRRLPCRDCDEEMRRLWYGDAYSEDYEQ